LLRESMRKSLAVYLLAAAAVLAGLFVLLRPAPPPAEPAAPQHYQLVVSGGVLSAGPDLIRVPQGTDLVLMVMSDQAGEFHLHGYDLHLDLQPQQPAQLAFKADRSGRFEYELHQGGQGGGELALGALEVMPR
jgi:hypothetical protein